MLDSSDVLSSEIIKIMSEIGSFSPKQFRHRLWWTLDCTIRRPSNTLGQNCWGFWVETRSLCSFYSRHLSALWTLMQFISGEKKKLLRYLSASVSLFERLIWIMSPSQDWESCKHQKRVRMFYRPASVWESHGDGIVHPVWSKAYKEDKDRDKDGRWKSSVLHVFVSWTRLLFKWTKFSRSVRPEVSDL